VNAVVLWDADASIYRRVLGPRWQGRGRPWMARRDLREQEQESTAAGRDQPDEGDWRAEVAVQGMPVRVRPGARRPGQRDPSRDALWSSHAAPFVPDRRLPNW